MGWFIRKNTSEQESQKQGRSQRSEYLVMYTIQNATEVANNVGLVIVTERIDYYTTRVIITGTNPTYRGDIVTDLTTYANTLYMVCKTELATIDRIEIVIKDTQI